MTEAMPWCGNPEPHDPHVMHFEPSHSPISTAWTCRGTPKARSAFDISDEQRAAEAEEQNTQHAPDPRRASR